MIYQLERIFPAKSQLLLENPLNGMKKVSFYFRIHISETHFKPWSVSNQQLN